MRILKGCCRVANGDRDRASARYRRGGGSWWPALAVLAVGAVLILFLTRQRAAAGIPLVQATTVGAAVFPDGDTPQGGNGQTVDGVSCSTSEQLVYHIHAHLSLFIGGRQVAVPRGIGIQPPRQVQQNFVVGGACFYWLHTHDATGIIHIESPLQKTYTLGDFFDIWGESLSTTDLAGTTGTVYAYVDGKPWTGDPRSIPLTAHQEITLSVGAPVAHPPVYQFPQGL